MPYLVRWQLAGPSKRPLDCGFVQEVYTDYGAAVAAVHEFLRLYPGVQRCDPEAYWLVRRSVDTDLTVWVWIEQYDTLEAVNAPKALGSQSPNLGRGAAAVMM